MGLWKWYCCGKHPVAADFFQIGEMSALAEHFNRWVQKGYEQVLKSRQKGAGLFSWRFWTQGLKGDELVLGLIRDSGDNRGRQFPILFLGAGSLTSWTTSWELLPLACDQSWSHIEHLAVKRLGSLQELKNEVQRIRPPLSQWATAQEVHDGADAAQDGEGIQAIAQNEPADPETMHFQIRLDDDDRSAVLLASCHSRMKRLRSGAVPQAVYMGGSQSSMHVKGFYRSLKPSDFVTLWSLR